MTAEEIRYPCNRCGRTYNMKSNLQRHIRDECGVEPKFCCPHCNYRSKRKVFNEQDEDLMLIGEEIRYPCGRCGKTYKYKVTDGQDFVVIGQEIRYPCERCDKTYKNRSEMRRHMKECGLEPRFPCPHCAYRTRRKADLKSHVAVRHLNFTLR
ncbi:longitudinals lacking protein, isoforms N/O/W/X/Y [Nilaparvata lugens]|uniref:longitudinals lacking protein, isoforms N/O/W/X/Y n=1 Tax=Nilaparvata lugens TaxID=108931 RepID=UPI00193E0C53|nr:longitudinals lacking protein, isoforms N/O/W/X/Y [Nilaparvata lugens]